MIVHDYECVSCKHIFEEWLTKHNTRVVCPECGSSKVQIIYTQPPRVPSGKLPYDYIRHNDDPPIKSVVPRNYKAAKDVKP